MNRRRLFLGSTLVASLLGACAHAPVKATPPKRAAAVTPAQPSRFEVVHPARYVFQESVGVAYDETGENSPIRGADPAIINGKRLMLDGGRIVGSAPFPEQLLGFRSLPARLGGGYVFWSDEHSYHAPTFLGKLKPIAKVGSRGGVRPWFDTFVLRTDLGPLEVKPGSLTVRRTELARFSEMLSVDGKLGIRTDPVGRMEASADAGKTFVPLVFPEGRRYSGPTVGPDNKLLFRIESVPDWPTARLDRLTFSAQVLGPAGTLIPFDPKAADPVELDPPVVYVAQGEPAYTRHLASSDISVAAFSGALVAGDQVIFIRESTLRVFSAKTGDLIYEQQLNLGSQEFGHCQPTTLGQDVFLACTHATGGHLYALRGAPTTVHLEATFPEVGTFVAGLGTRFLYTGRCGSTPPTVRDFPGYGLSEDTPPAVPADPNAPPAPPEPPPPPEDPPEKPAHDTAVCLRLDDGTWIERRIDELVDRKKTLFLPGDHGHVTVLEFGTRAADEQPPKPTEGVHRLFFDPKTTRFDATDFFQPNDSSEPKLRTISRDVWLDEKDGSVHGWFLPVPKEDDGESPPEPPELEESPAPQGFGIIGLLRVTSGAIVGVQIKTDGTLVKHPVPEGVDAVTVGGRYALARGKNDDVPVYFESTDGGRTYSPVEPPIPGEIIENLGGEPEGCSEVGCALGGGLIRLGWGGNAPAKAKSEDDEAPSLETLTSKVFDPHSLVPAETHRTLRCRLDGKDEPYTPSPDKPFTQTLALRRGADLGSPVKRKWTAVTATPFVVKEPYRVDFEDIDTDAIEGEGMPLLRSSATDPVGLFLRTKELRFDLSPGPKRKPVAMAPTNRGGVAAEVDKESFLFLDAAGGELQLVRGGTGRTILRVSLVPDVTQGSLTLARRVGSGSDVFAVVLIQAVSGDILLGDIDLGRRQVGPLRLVGNTRKLERGASCVHGPREYRFVMNEHLTVMVEPGDEERGGLLGSSLVSVGAGPGCLEASEMRLVNESTLTVRYAGADSAGHPAMVHERGKSSRATCRFE